MECRGESKNGVERRNWRERRKGQEEWEGGGGRCSAGRRVQMG